MVNNGLDSPYVREALTHHHKLFTWMGEALANGSHLGGNAYSIAECAVIPYLLRLELLRLNAL